MFTAIMQFPGRGFVLNLDHLVLLEKRQMFNDQSDYAAYLNAPKLDRAPQAAFGLSGDETKLLMERFRVLRERSDYKRYQYITTPEYIFPVEAVVAIQEAALPHISGGLMPCVTLVNGMCLAITSADYTDLIKQLKLG